MIGTLVVKGLKSRETIISTNLHEVLKDLVLT